MLQNEYITKLRKPSQRKEVGTLPLTLSIYDVTYDYADHLIENKDVIYTVEFSDKKVKLEGKWLLINAILLTPLIKRRMPISSEKYLVHNEIVNKQIYKINTCIYDEICVVEGMKHIVFEIGDCINMLTDLISCKLASYQKTIDIFKLKKTMQIPRLKELSNLDLSEAKKYGVKAVEDKLTKANNEAIDIINDPAYKDRNYIYGFAKLGVFNSFQLPQAIVAVGGRTDIDESVLPKVIENSYLQGLSSSADFAIDSLSARKAIYYNKQGIASAQYANRRHQLIATAVRKFYNHDCGTRTTIPFRINRKHMNHVIGINIQDGDHIVELTKHNVEKYADSIVRMYLPNTCNHPDGVCRKCGGGLTRYFHENIVIGPISATETISPITQTVLSAKHLLRVTIIQFLLDGKSSNIREYFTIVNNNIFLKDVEHYDDYVIGFKYNEASRIKDMSVINGDMAGIDGNYFTQITTISLYNRRLKKVLLNNVPLLLRDDIKAYLSLDMLNIIRKYKSKVIEVKDNTVWILVKDLMGDQPVITCPSISVSTLDFVKRVKNLQDSSSIRKYRSIVDFLRDATDLIWEKASPNIFHIATLLKASQITSFNDFSIPVVKDIDDMHFAEILVTIPRRSIGTELAFERFHKFLCYPSMFLYEKGVSFYDEFFKSTRDDLK